MKFSTLVAVGVLAVPLIALGSGGDGGYDESIYTPTRHVPASELDGYAAGRLGVVSGEYFRVYRVLAWRALHGAVLTPLELQGLELSEWRVGPASDTGDTGVDAWLAARSLIAPSAVPTTRFAVDIVGADYGSYVNCASDGLQRAALTARDRLQHFGNAAARTWLAGQDAVFANCSSISPRVGGAWRRPEPVLPEALPADAPAWLQADRVYQTAAAFFYAGQHAEARKGFLTIAADKRSPWQPLGAYLAARCLIREATLLGSGNPDPALAAESQRLLAQARRELVALAPRDPAAGRLVGWVDARLRPEERAVELARSLQAGPLAGAERVAMLSDYLRLMDGIDSADALSESAEPMTAWIGLMQSAARSGPKAAQRADIQGLARRHWRADGDVAWLMPLAIQARQLGELQADELTAMRAIPVSSPAWQTVHWHLARLELVAGRSVEADAAIDDVLKDPALATSTRNRWLQLKLASAQTLEAMLAAAPRTPVEASSPAGPIPDEGKKPVASSVDQDFTRRLYRQLPLSRLVRLGDRSDFPASLHASNAEIVFARALVLEDWAVADRLANDIAEPRTTTHGLYRRYLAAKTPRDKKLAAALILVNTPELNPSAVAVGGDVLYWGCGDAAAASTGPAVDPVLAVPAAFLNDAERSAAQRENAALGKLPVRSRWLADGLLPWAATKPSDPDAPKALHLLVASTRMECSSARPRPGDRNPSREAFELLHRLWPNSDWTAGTRYWFGN